MDRVKLKFVIIFILINFISHVKMDKLQFNEKDDEINQLKLKVEGLERSNGELNTQINKLNSEKEDELKRKDDEITNLQQDKNNLNAQVNRLNQNLKNEKAKITKLDGAISESSSSNKEINVNLYHRDLSNIIQNWNSLLTESKNYEYEKQESERKKQTINENIKSLKEKIQESKRTNVKINSRFDRSEKNFNLIIDTWNDLYNEKSQLEEKVQAIDADIKNLKRKIEDSKQSKIKIDSRFDSDDLNSIVTNWNGLLDDLKAEQTETSRLRTENENQKRNITGLETTIRNSNNNIGTLKSEISNSKSRKTKVSLKFLISGKELNNLIDNWNDLLQQSKNFETTIKTSNDNIVSLKSKISYSKSTKTEVSDRFQNSEWVLNNLINSWNDLLRESKNLEGDLKNEKTKNSRLTEQKNREVEALNKKYQNLENVKNQLNSTLTEKNTQIENQFKYIKLLNGTKGELEKFATDHKTIADQEINELKVTTQITYILIGVEFVIIILLACYLIFKRKTGTTEEEPYPLYKIESLPVPSSSNTQNKNQNSELIYAELDLPKTSSKKPVKIEEDVYSNVQNVNTNQDDDKTIYSTILPSKPPTVSRDTKK